ncbi:PH domain-containing protein [Micromonospora narathiwatensis]|nr:PH domain-containing protein [Micromonospora narathiwatensis]
MLSTIDRAADRQYLAGIEPNCPCAALLFASAWLVPVEAGEAGPAPQPTRKLATGPANQGIPGRRMDAAGHHGGMRRWQRPYSLDAVSGFAVQGLVAAVGVGTFLVVMFAREEVPTPLAILFGVWLTGSVAVTARRAMLGVYVSDDGIRSRSMLRTTTVPWASVSAVRSGAAIVAGLDQGRTAITIERTDGVSVPTPIQRGGLVRSFLFWLNLGQVATWPEHYDEILATLQAHHRDARRRRQTASDDRPAQPSAAGPASPSTDVGRAPTARDASTDDRRRDIHTLTRQHQRGALTDAEFAAELARIRDTD